MPGRNARGGMAMMLRRIGFLAGAGLFAWILLSSDLAAVWGQIRDIHWRFGLIVLFYGFIFALDTLGWKYTLSPKAQALARWGGLFRTRLAGEAVNYVTPAAWIGGEPVKAYLLHKRHGISLADGMASVVVAKTTFVLSMLLFILTGLVVTLLTQPVEASLYRWVWIILPAMILLMSLFVLVQFFQPFRRGISLISRIIPGKIPFLRKGLLRSLGSKVMQWDEAIASFYRRSPGAVFWSLSFHFLGWMAGVIEVYLILQFLRIPVSLSTAWSIEALWVLLRSGAFMIPASLGASEGFLLLICIAMGINAVSGLALGLIRRARELLLVALGLAEFSRG